MTATRAGISAKQLERELGVTYKTAWRMFHQIRPMIMMGDDGKDLSGEAEVDETYMHADPSKNSRVKREPGKRYYNSEAVFGMAELRCAM
jgi:transposase